MSIDPRWRIMLALASIWAASCTKRNPDLCCETGAECTAIGFSTFEKCDLGVCVQNECTTVAGACDDDLDCPDQATHCIAGTCAGCATSETCPTSAPICDSVEHSCRVCMKDSECDSLACDLAAGTCVDAANVLYASPDGAASAACTRLQPCTLRKTSEIVDASHAYIVLLPGNHTSGATFTGKTAVIVGGGATIDLISADFSLFVVQGASVITMRDVSIVDHLRGARGPTGIADHSAIEMRGASLTLENVQASTTNFSLLGSYVGGDNVLVLRRAKFENFYANSSSSSVTAKLTVDQSTFVGNGLFVQGAAEITNSVFNITDGKSALSLRTPTGSISYIKNNTIIGGSVTCADDVGLYKFNSNIILTSDTIDVSIDCSHSYTLTNGTALSGDSNITGDPHFKDAGNGDFSLLPGSPAIDAADPVQLANGHDFFGTPRPLGARADIGAIESH